MGKRRGYQHTQSLPRDDWCSPRKLLRLVYRLGPVGLDPMTNPHSLVKAEMHWFKPGLHPILKLKRYPDAYVAEVDALSPLTDWDGHGLVFVNPPYGRLLNRLAAEKIREQGEAGVEIVALVPASTGPKWFQRNYGKADAVCFWEGRLVFEGAINPKTGRQDPADFDSAIVYFGERVADFRRIFQPRGMVVEPKRQDLVEIELCRRDFQRYRQKYGESCSNDSALMKAS